MRREDVTHRRTLRGENVNGQSTSSITSGTYPSGERGAAYESSQEPKHKNRREVLGLDNGNVEEHKYRETADVYRVAAYRRHVLERREEHGSYTVRKHVQREAERRSNLRHAKRYHERWDRGGVYGRSDIHCKTIVSSRHRGASGT